MNDMGLGGVRGIWRGWARGKLMNDGEGMGWDRIQG